jgi:hypothetical protein
MVMLMLMFLMTMMIIIIIMIIMIITMMRRKQSQRERARIHFTAPLSPAVAYFYSQIYPPANEKQEAEGGGEGGVDCSCSRQVTTQTS